MAVASTMLPLGTPIPLFSLPDLEGQIVCVDDFWDARALLVIFLCPHCPYVRHVRGEIAGLAREYRPRGVATVAINSNDPAQYPQDGPEGMRQEAEEAGYSFPYLFDESQQVAKAFMAACTPDFFLFDEARTLAYRGQLDDSRPRNERPVTGRDLRAALDALLEGRPVPAEQAPSIGCSIKWKPGNQPAHFG
ncbi:MAG: thioredoxin family protein [Gemmatimonadota bacterium]|jgi:peroxiredoxin|nr:thioredoxin family protein [Gemmatimonadota bacterium]